MKKLSLLLTFLFVSLSVVFAQLNFTGGMSAGVRVLGNVGYYGQDYYGDDVYADLYNYGFNIEAYNQDDYSIVGFKFKFDWEDSTPYMRGTIWWKVLPEVFLKFGNLEEGPDTFYGAGIGGWSLHSNNQQNIPRYWWYNGYPGTALPQGVGFYGYMGLGNAGNEPNIEASFYPLSLFGLYTPDTLSFHVRLPAFAGAGHAFDNGLARNNLWAAYTDFIHLQARYEFYEFGEVAFSFVNHAGFDKRAAQDYFLHYKMNLPAGMGMEIGGQYRILRNEIPANGDIPAIPIDYEFPLRFGLGWRYGNIWGNDPVVIHTRLGISIPRAKAPDSMRYEYPTEGSDGSYDWSVYNNWHMMANIYYPVIGMDIAPSFWIKDLGLRLYIPVGFGLILADDRIKDSSGNKSPYITGFIAAPYIVKQFGGINLWAGFQIFNGEVNPIWENDTIVGPVLSLNPDNSRKIKWGIPICIELTL